MDPSFRNTIPVGAALFATLDIKRRHAQTESDPSAPAEDPDLSDSIFPFDSETFFSGY